MTGKKTVKVHKDKVEILERHPRLKVGREKFVQKALDVISVLRREGHFNGKPVEVSVVFDNGNFLRKLKKKYFGMNVSTDVVAFPQMVNPKYKIQNIKLLEVILQDMTPLGDVVISLDHAKRQAREHGHSFFDEVLYLYIHGVLHLLGFQDAPERAAKQMLEKQNCLWDNVRHAGYGKKAGRKKSTE